VNGTGGGKRKVAAGFTREAGKLLEFRMTFLREFIARPAAIGAVTSSSRFLARTIVSAVDLHKADAILEYGPGTGAFTSHILQKLKPGAQFAAIELNPAFADSFQARYPNVQLFRDSVANVEAICRRAGIAAVDCIVSGLPWATFPQALQRQCLDAMMRVLRPGGRFVTFTYVHSLVLPAARQFSNLLPASVKCRKALSFG
jgi:phosphatidylethanolamine/phosphatidyl-N-methylethanolamine N-methyltransferase